MPLQHKKTFSVVLATGLLLSFVGSLQAVGPDEAKLKNSRQQGIKFLSVTQSDDGSWTSPHAPGITALVAHSLLQSGVSQDDEVVQAAFTHLKSHLKADGGIYDVDSSHRNYETSIALMAFQAANADGRHNELIQNAVKFLKKVQWDEEETGSKADPAFGGSGYGKHQRPDLSNTTFFVEALKTAGVSSNDPAMQNALIFISRCQNLESEHNTTEFASKVNDGGFYYTIAAGGSSQAGTTPNGGLRSYASMTYAGLKSMIYAGVKEDDQRVKAARNWIKQFYTLDENPGMGQQGLFYYYHTFAKTLAVLKVDEFEEADGTKHDWRQELANHLFQVQKKNGSWVNPTDRWFEGDPNLVTAYALLALSYCDPPASN
ncbi:prenyltransferase/squalene oxidase repeat-containing protein [Thalassoglobus sp.]|uniref:prenyltransferase/squalene oxidase repeat-containing protein n=1 Tax=Thalassoglobus sp. TaxID=2795869 RepID=UPI003AA994C8